MISRDFEAWAMMNMIPFQRITVDIILLFGPSEVPRASLPVWILGLDTKPNWMGKPDRYETP